MTTYEEFMIIISTVTLVVTIIKYVKDGTKK